MDRPLIYLASPYTATSFDQQCERAGRASNALASLLSAGVLTYSPISHTHPVAGCLPSTWEFWRMPSLCMLDRCDCLVVLMLPGWSDSVGVRAEIAFAHERYMPIVYWEPEFVTAVQLAEQLSCVKRRNINSMEHASQERPA